MEKHFQQKKFEENELNQKDREAPKVACQKVQLSLKRVGNWGEIYLKGKRLKMVK